MQSNRPEISEPLEKYLVRRSAAPTDSPSSAAGANLTLVAPFEKPTEDSDCGCGDILFNVELEDDLALLSEQLMDHEEPTEVDAAAFTEPSASPSEQAFVKLTSQSDEQPRPPSPTLGHHLESTMEGEPIAPKKHGRQSASSRTSPKAKSKEIQRRMRMRRERVPPALDLRRATARDSRLPAVSKSPYEQTLRTPNGLVRVVVLPSDGDRTETPLLSGTWFDASEEEQNLPLQSSTKHSRTDKQAGQYAASEFIGLWKTFCASLLKSLAAGGQWLAVELEGEAPLEPGHVRVRWTCVSSPQSTASLFYPNAMSEMRREIIRRFHRATARRRPRAGARVGSAEFSRI